MDIGAFAIATEGFILYGGNDTPPVEIMVDNHETSLLFVEEE